MVTRKSTENTTGNVILLSCRILVFFCLQNMCNLLELKSARDVSDPLFF